ncbi:nuclear pore complex protein DDB_G0274915 [Sergentomyia squamirostris]
MAMVNVFSLIFVLLITTNEALGHPAPQSDIISGQDFLSLFSGSRGLSAATESRDSSKYLKQLEEDDTMLPIEKLFLANEEMVADSSNHFSFEKRTNRKLDTFTATATLKTPPTETTDGDKVKTGSVEPSTTTEAPKDVQSSTKVPMKLAGDVRVIGVSVSSSVAQQRSSTPQRDFPVDASPARQSGSDFSIEENEPLTTLNKDVPDSVREESTNVHSFVAPPDAVSPSLPQQPPQPVRSRTQRKQDDVVPYQAIIYHDGDEKKERTPLPRSISYTSVGQTIGEPKLWRDFNLHHRNKTENTVLYSQPEKIYGEPAKIYSVPAKIYGQPSKIYSEPAKIYSEPAKIYSEPSKIYSEPAKVYGKPAKVYGQPPTPFPPSSTPTPPTPTTTKKIVFNLDKLPYDLLNRPQSTHHPHFRPRHFTPSSTSETQLESSTPTNTFVGYPTPEHNYEVDEAVSVVTNGRHHGIQSPSAATPTADDAKKVGYVVEGRNFRKYRVEEKTADGFIVGEYGVVSHDDGSLRGVRYTADSNISPSLIYNALLKFLSL